MASYARKCEFVAWVPISERMLVYDVRARVYVDSHARELLRAEQQCTHTWFQLVTWIENNRRPVVVYTHATQL